MSSQLGVPIAASEPGPTVGFDHLPTLEDLLPGPRWWLGVTYAEICTHNQLKARNLHGLSVLRGGSAAYTINGPRGTAEVILMGVGIPIPGASPHQGRPELYHDAEIARLTGLTIPDEWAVNFQTPGDTTDVEVSKPQDERRGDGLPEGQQSGKGHARMGAGSAAQRQ